jgi:hypothetical protein
MLNHKFSKTFSISVVMIIAGFFLLPNLVNLMVFKSAERRYEKEEEQRQLEREQADKQQANLIKALESIPFSDSRLRQCIINKLGSGFISSYGINSPSEITVVDCSSSNIRSLDGIEYLSGLTKLELSYNKISDLSALRKLRNLENLSIDINPVKQLNQLYDIPSLRTVAVPDTPYISCEQWRLFKSSIEHKRLTVSNRNKLKCNNRDDYFSSSSSHAEYTPDFSSSKRQSSGFSNSQDEQSKPDPFLKQILMKQSSGIPLSVDDQVYLLERSSR